MRLTRVNATLCALALLVAACGSSRDSSESGSAATATSEESTTTEVGSQAQRADEPVEEPVEVETPMFGDAQWPCGPGESTGSTAQGVTDDAIRIGVGDDRGFPQSPGLNKELTDALLVAIDVCNELGGIDGRRVEAIIYDAAIFDAGQVILEACDQAFMLVGHLWVLDGSVESERVACDLAAIPASTISADFSHGPFVAQPLPNPADQENFGVGWIMENVVAAEMGLDVSISAGIYPNFASSQEQWEKTSQSWGQNTGFEFPTALVFNATGEDDWTPFVLELKNRGTEVAYFLGTCLPDYQGIRQAAAINEVDLAWVGEPVFYDRVCADANADGGLDSTYLRMFFVPFEEAEHNKATADFLEMVRAGGVKPSILGAQAVSAFLLWARAATTCGSELTQECVLDQVATIGEWTGHGLHVAADPTSKEKPPCVAVVELKGAGYRRVFPTEPATFACAADVGDDNWVVTVETTASQAAQLDEDRVSTLYTE